MTKKMKESIDDVLTLLAVEVYTRPTEAEQEEVYNYIGEKAQEIFAKFRDANDFERVMMALGLMADMNRAKKELDLEDDWDM